MGLSRNKVAVSEGAAGSPPFYGDNTASSKDKRSDEIETNVPISQEAQKTKNGRVKAKWKRISLFDFQGTEPWKTSGGVAQLGEHLPCKQGVKSSNLFISTKGKTRQEQHTGS